MFPKTCSWTSATATGSGCSRLLRALRGITRRRRLKGAVLLHPPPARQVKVSPKSPPPTPRLTATSSPLRLTRTGRRRRRYTAPRPQLLSARVTSTRTRMCCPWFSFLPNRSPYLFKSVTGMDLTPQALLHQGAHPRHRALCTTHALVPSRAFLFSTPTNLHQLYQLSLARRFRFTPRDS